VEVKKKEQAVAGTLIAFGRSFDPSEEEMQPPNDGLQLRRAISIQAEGKTLLEKHAIAPSAARLCSTARQNSQGTFKMPLQAPAGTADEVNCSTSENISRQDLQTQNNPISLEVIAASPVICSVR
jgi:hypothetical protein